MYKNTHASTAAGVRWLAVHAITALVVAAFLAALAVETVDCGGDEVLAPANTGTEER